MTTGEMRIFRHAPSVSVLWNLFIFAPCWVCNIKRSTLPDVLWRVILNGLNRSIYMMGCHTRNNFLARLFLLRTIGNMRVCIRSVIQSAN